MNVATETVVPQPPHDLALPKITAEMWEEFQDEEFIEDSPRWNWTQAAVDFACEIVRPAVWAEVRRLREALEAIHSHAQDNYDGPEDHTHGPYLELAGVALGKMP